MQFDDLDKKFREAAEHHHPPYDEKAWSNMEKMLDKHMPVEEKKRRFLFIILFLSLIGISGLLVMQPWKTRQGSAVISEKKSGEQKTIAGETNAPTPENSVALNSEPGNINEQVSGKPSLFNSNKPLAKFHTGDKNIFGIENKTVRNSRINKDPLITSSGDNPSNYQPVNDRAVNRQEPAITDAKNDKPVPLIKNDKKDNDNEETKLVLPGTSADKPGNESLTKSTDNKNKKKKTHNFFISLGGGPDISYTRAGERGNLKLFGGAGLGYTYNNRLSLRVGFYSGRKIYTADPYDYNAPAIFYTYYPNLQKVDANCKVYEVPVALSYHFGKKDKRNFFASAGLSSYFMKKETYNYFYKATPTGPTVSKTRSIDNGSDHYFAGLSLSAGYTRNINKRVSVTIEPYTKIPLQGIGYGRVKLNSTGVLFSVGIQPIQKNR